MISTPQYSWEMHGLPINEGPQILIEDGKLHIIYSASGFWTPQYALGRLTYNGTGSLLDPASWTKAAQPVFQAAGSVVGVGHASFTKSPDGTENWIVYHAHRNPPAPAGEELRDVRIQPFTFFANGTPNFGPPLPLSQTIAAPSTGPDPERPFVVGDYNADGAVGPTDHTVWRATFGATVFPGTAADGNGNGVVDAADYIIWRKNQGSGAAAASSATAIAAEPATTTRQSTTNESDTALAEFAPSPSVFARLERPAPRPSIAALHSTSAANLRQDDLLLTQLAIAKLEVPIEQYRGTTLSFPDDDHNRVAVKIMDDRGIESLRIVGLE